MGAKQRAVPDRTTRQRQAIMTAAADVFMRNGYVGATTDEIAALAAVSKQTVYKMYGDKQKLFAEVILETTLGTVERLASTVSLLERSNDARAALRMVAEGWLRGLLAADVLRLRRLVIAEADRFPEVGRAWFERGFDRALVILGDSLQEMAGRGLLRSLDDPRRAAYQFAGLVMYQPMNQAMFAGSDGLPSARELKRIAHSAVEVFLAAYGPATA
ncbi:TetR/AcrR family transcriptional regulator [Micromonospora globbae]|uniref:TetR/AcrR family transcriptional regulator n=1 Tax=Micromonospora globbae TaxID=1894969 RepID=A0A420ETJ6_9ACTN|nr:TetR/AcrR family transcriptional regulator [Micromonospora globbae]RKF24034.1 TetR/AcrR family transcriptional regulator [Micromonospora globbae]WTF88689.1 TetR/AcrR family transcriptional regulator [Micromonospora globbae]